VRYRREQLIFVDLSLDISNGAMCVRQRRNLAMGPSLKLRCWFFDCGSGAFRNGAFLRRQDELVDGQMMIYMAGW
jgi:hypothetical protein